MGFLSGKSGDDRGESLDNTKNLGSKVKAISASSDVREYMWEKDRWLPNELPTDLPAVCPQVAQIFAYGATGPACDAYCLVDDIEESDDYVSQAMLEVMSLLSISTERQVSVGRRLLGEYSCQNMLESWRYIITTEIICH